MISTYESHLGEKQGEEVGRLHLVLVYEQARQGQWKGRTDTFKKVILTADTLLLSSDTLLLSQPHRHTLMQQLHIIK